MVKDSEKGELVDQSLCSKVEPTESCLEVIDIYRAFCADLFDPPFSHCERTNDSPSAKER